MLRRRPGRQQGRQVCMLAATTAAAPGPDPRASRGAREATSRTSRRGSAERRRSRTSLDPPGPYRKGDREEGARARPMPLGRSPTRRTLTRDNQPQRHQGCVESQRQEPDGCRFRAASERHDTRQSLRAPPPSRAWPRARRGHGPTRSLGAVARVSRPSVGLESGRWLGSLRPRGRAVRPNMI
jgi:hypothetical protein